MKIKQSGCKVDYKGNIYMMSKEKQLPKDLQKFIEKFEPNKFKVMSSGIEVRGVTDIHNAIDTAKKLIQKLKLNLTISHTADMVGYGGFEVNVQG